MTEANSAEARSDHSTYEDDALSSLLSLLAGSRPQESPPPTPSANAVVAEPAALPLSSLSSEANSPLFVSSGVPEEPPASLSPEEVALPTEPDSQVVALTPELGVPSPMTAAQNPELPDLPPPYSSECVFTEQDPPPPATSLQVGATLSYPSHLQPEPPDSELSAFEGSLSEPVKPFGQDTDAAQPVPAAPQTNPPNIEQLVAPSEAASSRGEPDGLVLLGSLFGMASPSSAHSAVSEASSTIDSSSDANRVSNLASSDSTKEEGQTSDDGFGILQDLLIRPELAQMNRMFKQLDKQVKALEVEANESIKPKLVELQEVVQALAAKVQAVEQKAGDFSQFTQKLVPIMARLMDQKLAGLKQELTLELKQALIGALIPELRTTLEDMVEPEQSFSLQVTGIQRNP